MPLIARSATRAAIVVAAGLAASALVAKCALGHPLRTLVAMTQSAASLPSAPLASTLPVPPTVLGMNMGDPSYWSTEWTFNDPIQSTGQIFVWDAAGPHPFENQTKVDSDGRPIDVAAGTQIDFMVQNHNGPRLSGTYICHIAPGWDLNPGVAQSRHGTSFTMIVAKDRADQRVELMLTAQKNHAALGDFGCAEKGVEGLFNPKFLDDVRPFRIVRFMDWARVNNAPKRLWSERPTANAVTQAGPKGVALESMVALCTQLACDPWFNLPLDTDDAYYREFATYVRDHLPKDRKVYVELSNEVWNLSFEQGKQALQRGHAAYPGVGDVEAMDYYYADRVRALMAVWRNVFAGQEQRLVRVYGAQAANVRRAETGLMHKDTWRSVDALAIAPYFGGFLQDLPGSGAARVDAAFAHAPADVDLAIRNALDNKVLAARLKLGFLTYEGGQHYFGYTPDAVADVKTMQHDPRMCIAYRDYLDRWAKQVGGPLVLYDSVGAGGFAHKDYTGQPVADAPKMRAILGLPCTGPVPAHPA